MLEDTGIRRETVDYTKRYQLGNNERLSTIAAREYNDPGKWRFIAAANGIDDPDMLQAGDWIELPRLPLDERKALRIAEGRTL